MIIVMWEKQVYTKSKNKRTLTSSTRRYRKTFNSHDSELNEAKAKIYTDKRKKQGHSVEIIRY